MVDENRAEIIGQWQSGLEGVRPSPEPEASRGRETKREETAFLNRAYEELLKLQCEEAVNCTKTPKEPGAMLLGAEQPCPFPHIGSAEWTKCCTEKH